MGGLISVVHPTAVFFVHLFISRSIGGGELGRGGGGWGWGRACPDPFCSPFLFEGFYTIARLGLVIQV